MLSHIWKFILDWVVMIAIAPEYQGQDKFEFTGQTEQVAFALK